MADSDFWRERADEFESLDDPRGFIRALYHPTRDPPWLILSARDDILRRS
jgi:hypothetical protein